METGDKVNILLVDDKPENLVALAALLEPLNENLVTARSGAEALKHLLSDEYAVVLLDVQMPEMDGFQTAALIREREKTQQTPIIFVTAMYSQEDYAVLGYSLGAVDYVIKPLSPEILRSKVQVFVDLYRKGEQIKQQSERLRELQREEYEQRLAQTIKRLNEETYRARQELLAKEKEAELLLRSSQQLREADRLKREFLAQVSHEIRTPMTGVIGLAELLLDTNLDGEQKELVTLIRDSGLALLGIINDVLDLSKVEAGKLVLEHKDFDLAELVSGAADLFAPAARDKGVDLSLEIDPALPDRLNGDPLRLRQILLNLISNAVKFTSEGSIFVKVNAEAYEGEHVVVRFSIEDTGPGLSAEEAKRLFQPFAQVGAGGKYGGTGLGLFISERLVDLMNGKIGVSSQKGRGSTFWFQVPLEVASGIQERAERVSSRTKGQARAPGGRGEAVGLVLVAEDNPINQRVTVMQLKQLGYSAHVVSTGKEAVSAYTLTHYELVLMDCQLPEMDGYDATRAIREYESKTGRRTPIVGLTAEAMTGSREECLSAGMDDFIPKPATLDVLRAVLERWLPGSEEVMRKVVPQTEG